MLRAGAAGDRVRPGRQGGVGLGWRRPDYKWGNDGHGIHVGYNNFVWVGDNNADTGGHIYKFTCDGKFVMRIGKPGKATGSNDTEHLGRPADMVVAPATNELFVAYRSCSSSQSAGSIGAGPFNKVARAVKPGFRWC